MVLSPLVCLSAGRASGPATERTAFCPSRPPTRGDDCPTFVTRCGVGFLLGLHKPNSTGVGSGKGGTNLCEHEDRLWCDRAIARGYDSIQLLRGTYYDAKGKRRAFGELVICTDECTSKPFENYACVPAARTGSG